MLIDGKCTNDELHFGMPGGSGDNDHEGDESEKHDAIPTTSRWRTAATKLNRFHLATSDVDGYEGEDGDDADADVQEEVLQAHVGSTHNVEDWRYSLFELGTSDVYGYKGEDGDNADADEEAEPSQADDASLQNVEDWGHSTSECEDWTVSVWPAKYENCKANAMAWDVLQAKTIL